MANIYNIHSKNISSFDELIDEIESLLVAKRSTEQLTSVFNLIAEKTSHVEDSIIDKYFQLVSNISCVPDASHFMESINSTKNYNETKKDDEFTRLVREAAAPRENYAPYYSFFEPAYRFADILDTHFKELNPGKIIGEYLKLIFPGGDQDICISYSNAKKKHFSVTIKSASAMFLYNVGVKLLSKCSIDNEARKIYKLTLFTFFYWEHRVSDNDFTNLQRVENQLTIVHFFKNFFRYPDHITEMWLEEFDIDGRLDDTEIFGEDVAGIFDAQNKITNNYFLNKISPLVLNLLPRLHLKELGCDYYRGGKKISFSSIIKISYMLRDEVIKPEKDTIQELCRFLEEYKTLRVNTWKETVPFCSPEELVAYYFVVKETVDVSNLDFTVLLSRACYDFGELDFSEYLTNNNFEFKSKFQNSYIQLIKTTHDAGYIELSTAILSFYVFSLSFVEKGSIGDLQIIIPLLEKALKGVGREMLFKALEFVIEIANIFPNEPGNLLLAKILIKYTRKNSSIQLVKDSTNSKSSMGVMVREKHRNSKEEVINDLYNYFGEEQLHKLQKTSFEYLVDADWMWSNIFKYQGREKYEWSNIIISYCLVIEAELVFHFQPMLKEFKELQSNPSAEVTLGTAVWALDNKAKSPNFSCAVKSSKLHLLSENKKLLGRLRNFAKQWRNKASHVPPVSDRDIVDFRREYFDDGLLRDLLNSF